MQKIAPADIFIVAAEEEDRLSYNNNVKAVIDTASKESYLQAGKALEKFKPDVVVLQHEYGLYGGRWSSFRAKGIDEHMPSGSYLLELLAGISAPIVTTLHTVLPDLDSQRSKVLGEIVKHSKRVVVMTKQSKDIISRQWPEIASKTAVIPHGVELRKTAEPKAKILKRLKLPADKFYLTVSGLIGPNKNIEAIIKALPSLVDDHPQVHLLVIGQTHPQIIKNVGERYRQSLKKLAKDLGVSQNISFVNSYITSELLLDYLAVTDVYLTIHNDPLQSASGTLAYAVGNGLVSVSTPYAYARELLAGKRGLLVPFNNPEAINEAVVSLIKNKRLYKAVQDNASKYGEQMSWNRVAEAYWRTINAAIAQQL